MQTSADGLRSARKIPAVEDNRDNPSISGCPRYPQSGNFVLSYVCTYLTLHKKEKKIKKSHRGKIAKAEKTVKLYQSEKISKE